MTFKTNNDAWRAGYTGQQLPKNLNAQEFHDFQQGLWQKSAEEQKKQADAWKNSK